jgi:tetratricopeptide (TPR) repeat protein
MSDNNRDQTGRSAGLSQGTSPPQQPAAQLSNRRKWYFRTAALVLPVALILIVEVLLVTFNAGNNLGLFVKLPGAPGILAYQVNPRAEESYFAGRQLAGPEPKRFDLPRPDGVYRIVVVGGSTVLGFPYPPELSFPRQLEVLLNQQSDHERFEIINVGMVAINSFSVADVVEQSVAMQPDLIIVHTGHNEFYGPGGVASTTATTFKSQFSLVAKLRRLRLFQLIASGLVDEPSDRKDLMEELPASVTVQRDGPRFKQAEKYYRENLEQMVLTASSSSIPIVLTTVASNLSNHSPVSFHLPENIGTEDLEQWRAFFDQGRQLTVAKRWREALEQLKQADAISSDSSLLHYRMGQCLQALQRHRESRQKFELARDLDGCRFRAPGSFRGIVGDVARRTPHSNVFFIDSAEQLAIEAGPETLGANHFLEHVHYNLDGHRLLALILSRFVQQQVLQRQWDVARVPRASTFDTLLGLLPEDQLSGQSHALRVMNVFPMSKTFDVNIHREAIVVRIKRGLATLSAEQQQVFANLSLDDMAMRLSAALGDHFRNERQFAQELFYRRSDQVRRPWDSDVAFRLARCLADSDDHLTEAIEFCERALQLNPQHVAAGNLRTQLYSAQPRE